MASDLLREVARKSFHLLTLGYLAAYFWLDRPALWIGVWFAAVALFEITRLYVPFLNRLLLVPFKGILREEEAREVSGMFHTSLGAWLVVLLFGADRVIVTGALLCLAFGDAAAALAGKSFGRHPYKIGGKKKSVEGSVACLGVCFASLLYSGAPWPAALAGAAVGTAVEAAPVVNDNSVLPLAVAVTLSLLQ